MVNLQVTVTAKCGGVGSTVLTFDMLSNRNIV